MNLRLVLEEGLAGLPVLDVHTHLDAAHLPARGLHDILLYHMVISDLTSAGCPTSARLSADPDGAEAEARLREALPYLPYIQNTSCFWMVRIILRDLYGWTDPILPDNWRRLDGAIRERAHDTAWPRQILRQAGIRRACTQLWHRRDGSADDILQYAMERLFFLLFEWDSRNDHPLYDLESVWNAPGAYLPAPILMGEQRPPNVSRICTVNDVHAAIHDYVASIPRDAVVSTSQHISTDVTYRPVTEAEMQSALDRRQKATPADRDVFASYLLEALLEELERQAADMVHQFCIGAEPLPFETGSKLRQETVFELAAVVARHPRLRFQLFSSNEHTNQSLCTLARELPNLSLAACWWHNFFPTTIRKVLSERLDMLAANQQIGFFSDAYCADWCYGKVVLFRKQLAAVLAEKVEQGQYSVDEALAIARQLVFESPQTLLGMSPGTG
jgi:glucuronate isomerase